MICKTVCRYVDSDYINVLTSKVVCKDMVKLVPVFSSWMFPGGLSEFSI